MAESLAHDSNDTWDALRRVCLLQHTHCRTASRVLVSCLSPAETAMTERVAIVSGANRGIGFALAKALASQFDGVVYLTARDLARGEQAAEAIRAEVPGSRLLVHQLDVASDESVATFAAHITEKHGGVDIVISNAGFAPRPNLPLEEDLAETDILNNTNNRGTLRLIRAFSPLLRPNARYLVIASGFGTLKLLDEKLHAKFDVETLDLDQIQNAFEEYVAAKKAGNWQELGWPEWNNIPSKIGQTALGKVFARQVRTSGPPGVLVNVVCPGWTVTDASRPYLDENLSFKGTKAKQPDEAAVDVLWAATLPEGTSEPHGELLQYRKVLQWKP
eukprot:TRINITY_DN12982_c0_g1_i1.p1 TRINITY_DN12982_c0_g1~~TRINITY_DN12982_c0_g1_i1.p1  ORF type:complete len:332 (+),score=60.15 TRINITY_DN12982_c0_g1_i1:427-1422(+)